MAANDNQALLLQVSADIRGLEKAFDRAAGVVKKRSKEMEDSGSRLEKFFGRPSLPKAMDKVFDSTRFKVLDSGVARVGLFGSALEALGPIGIAAAAGIGLTAVAVSQLHKAMDFADEIGDTAAKLQVSTDTLQEYRYALHALGGETSDADAAIGSFQETLGKAEAGAQKALKWFKALGFTREQLLSFKSTDEALKAVLDRIGKLPTEAQRAGAASALGLSAMIPAINAGTAKFDELREAAHRIGYVLDSETINRLGEAKDKMEDLSVVTKSQLASALVDLAPVILKVSQSIADMARTIADLLDKIRNLRAEVQSQFRAQPANERELKRRILKLLPGGFGKDIIDFYGLEENAPTIGAKTPAAPRRAATGANLELPGKDNSAAEARKALERRRASDAAIDAAQKDELAARAALTDSISEQLAFKLQEIEAERAHKNDQLDYQAQLKTITNEAAEQAKAINDQTAVEQAMLATREAALKLEQDALAQRQAVDRYYQEISDIEASMARTVKERYRIELKNLEHVQRLERDALQTQLDAEVESGKRSQSSADELLAAQADAQSAQRRKLAHDNQGPLADYIDKLPQSIDEVNERMQALAVQGIEGLNDAIVDLATGAGDATDILRNLVRQMLADFTRLELQQIEGSIFKGKSGGNFLSAALSFGASLFSGASGASLSASAASMNAAKAALVAAGLAEGTDYAQGGITLVGERGPELLNIPRGSQVVPNDILRMMAGRGSGGATSHVFSPTLHLYVTPTPGMSAAEARRTGSQIGAAAMERMARARKKGIAA